MSEIVWTKIKHGWKLVFETHKGGSGACTFYYATEKLARESFKHCVRDVYFLDYALRYDPGGNVIDQWGT